MGGQLWAAARLGDFRDCFNVFPDTPSALAPVYGRRKSGKTFLSIDAGLCIATGIEWHGRKVKMGRVLHIVGEGNIGGVKNRVEAWLAYHADKSGKSRQELESLILQNWQVVPVPVHVDKPDVLREFIEANPGEFALVIIDTVLRNMSGDVLDWPIRKSSSARAIAYGPR